MLVLTRRELEKIRIGDDITITVLDIRGDQVRIGIDAPRHIAVHREEIYQALQAENIAAQSPDPDLVKGLAATLASSPIAKKSVEKPGKQEEA